MSLESALRKLSICDRFPIALLTGANITDLLIALALVSVILKNIHGAANSDDSLTLGLTRI